MEAEAGTLKSLILAGEPGEPDKSHPEIYIQFYCTTITDVVLPSEVYARFGLDLSTIAVIPR